MRANRPRTAPAERICYGGGQPAHARPGSSSGSEAATTHRRSSPPRRPHGSQPRRRARPRPHFPRPRANPPRLPRHPPAALRPRRPDRRIQPPHPCPAPTAEATNAALQAEHHCQQNESLHAVVTRPVKPLTPRGKAHLALRDFTDPFNFITIAGYSGLAIAANAHSAFGPGPAGWGRLTGYGLAEDAQGEFTGTFLIPSLVHEDPRYYRLPNAPVKRRILHALAHTYVSQHDDGTRMINYATLINYPLSAEIANLYVPGIPTNARATTRRFLTGIATDPSGTLVAEFLPDVARHIHVRVIFIQEIVNQVVTGANAPNVQ